MKVAGKLARRPLRICLILRLHKPHLIETLETLADIALAAVAAVVVHLVVVGLHQLHAVLGLVVAEESVGRLLELTLLVVEPSRERDLAPRGHPHVRAVVSQVCAGQPEVFLFVLVFRI